MGGAAGRSIGRPRFNLLASRWPLGPLPGLPVVYPERYLAAQVATAEPAPEVHVAHVPPGSSRGLIKVEMLEALVDRLGSIAERPRILCGDFNTPREELADGTVRFWGDRRPAHRERWNRAEHAVVLGLAEHDLADVFRRLNGYSLEGVSWSSQRTTGRHSRRYDHVFASAALGATACDYHDSWREHGLSDHAAIEADFASW